MFMFNKPTRQLVLAWLGWALLVCGITSLRAAGLPPGRLLYCGETSKGWQVFQVDLPDGKPEQLTFSTGDKREPSWLGSRAVVVYRDGGALSQVDSNHLEQGLASGEGAWAGYSFFPSADRLLMTRLVGQRTRRQHVFSYHLLTKKEVPFAMARRGSYGNIQLSPDGLQLALTHVVTYGSERLASLRVAQSDASPTYLTPEDSMAEYPRWSNDGKKIYCGLQLSGAASMQIYEIDIATGQATLLPLGEASKNTAPSPALHDQGLFFQTTRGGNSNIAYWNRQTGEVVNLDLGRSVAEPYYFVP
jgi:hypothetical protein